MAVVLEIGPAEVRRFGGKAGDPEEVFAALNGIDDPVVLVDESPTETTEVWRALLASLMPSGPAESVRIVYPSWWTRQRVDLVVGATGVPARDVIAVPRRDLIVAGRRSAVVIEIAADLVAVSNGAELEARVRADVMEIVRIAAAWAPPETSTVLLDAPRSIPGSAETAAAITDALWADRIAVRRVDVAVLAMSAAVGVDRPKRRRRGIALAVSVTLLTAVAATVATRISGSEQRTSSLVEGSVAVDVPVGWVVEKVTRGAGSRRIQVSSTAYAGAALHITQTYAPGTTLAQAADVLGRAASAQPAGVFVDFRPHDEVAGRLAVTYREIRPGKVVRWSVVLVGATRVGIGCQSAAGRENSISEVCIEAIRSVRELAGTSEPPSPSN
ncbi:MAG: type VII secretion-associated protein [Mycobacterium sp.]|nr:type VII secretion-associated protein [Mycobacterium sp.]